MASGVKVDDATVDMYQQLKMRKTNIRFLMMFIDEGTGLIKVDHDKIKDRDSALSQEEEFQEFLDELPSDAGRYCLLDLTIPQKNGAIKDIMFLITWCPEKSPMKSNILYTTSKKALTDKIREGTIDIQANDLSDLEYRELLEKGRK